MSTYLRAPEAARRLGVTLPTLYAYVSRGRVHRTRAADGRTSLFDLDEIERLRSASGRPTPPPPSIDVQISTGITQLDEQGLRYRGVPVAELTTHGFERVAEFLWTGELPPKRPRWTAPDNLPSIQLDTTGLLRLASSLAADAGPGDHDGDGIAETRALLAAIPAAAGVDDGGTFAARLARVWQPRPTAELVNAIDIALVLLADHELATSALAVRVATSVRASPYPTLLAGLATVEGALHGGAAAQVHRFLDEVDRVGDAEQVLDRRLSAGRQVPGFGHAIYRHRDPRVEPLLHAVRAIPDPAGRFARVDDVLRSAGSRLTQQPNVDLALGALTFVADLPDDAPLFAVARLAGWTAHRGEELAERPIRFRGLAR